MGPVASLLASCEGSEASLAGSLLDPMGNAHTQSSNWATFRSSEDIARFESDLKLLRSCSPDSHLAINWDEERSVMSHVTINTMENIVMPARLSRSASLSSLPAALTQRLRRQWAPSNARVDAGRGGAGLKRSVSFSTPLHDTVDIDGCCAADDG